MKNIYRSEDGLIKVAESEAIRRHQTAYYVAETDHNMERVASNVFRNKEVFEYVIGNMIARLGNNSVDTVMGVQLTELEIKVLKRVMNNPNDIPGGHRLLFAWLAGSIFNVALYISLSSPWMLERANKEKIEYDKLASWVVDELPYGSVGKIVLEMLEKPISTKLLQSMHLVALSSLNYAGPTWVNMTDRPNSNFPVALQRLLRPAVNGLGENRHEQATKLILDWFDKNAYPPSWLMKEFDEIMSGKVDGEKFKTFRQIIIDWPGLFYENNFPEWSAKYLEMLMRGDPPYHVMADKKREIQSRIMDSFLLAKQPEFINQLLSDAMLSGEIDENSYINKLTNYLISEKNKDAPPRIKDEWLEPVVGKLLRDGRFRDDEGRQAAVWWLQRMGGGELETPQKTASASTPLLRKDRFDGLIRTMLSAASKRMSSPWQPPVGAEKLKMTERSLRSVWEYALTNDVPDVLHNHMIVICEQYGGWPGMYVSAMRFLPQLMEKYGEAGTLLSIMKTKTANDFEEFMFGWHHQHKKNMAETEAIMEYKKTFKIGENMHWRVEMLATAPAISAHSTHQDHTGIDSDGVAKPLLVYDIYKGRGSDVLPLNKVGSLFFITPKNPKHQGEGYTARINSMHDEHIEEYFGSEEPEENDMYSIVKTSVVNEHGDELDRDAWRAVVLGRPMPKGFVRFVEQNANPEMSEFLLRYVSDTEWEGNENDALDDLQSGQSFMNLIIRRLEALVRGGSESRLKQFLLNMAADRNLLESFSSTVHLYGLASWRAEATMMTESGGFDTGWSRRNVFAEKLGNVIKNIAKENSDSTPESFADLVFALMHSHLIDNWIRISIAQQASPCRWIKRLWALAMLSGDLGDEGMSIYTHHKDDGSNSPLSDLNPQVMKKMLPDSQAAADLIERSYLSSKKFQYWSPAMAQLNEANEDSELPTIIKDMIDMYRQEILGDKRVIEYAERYCRVHGHLSDYSKKIMIGNLGNKGGILPWQLEPKKGVPEFAVIEVAKECAKSGNRICKRLFLEALFSQLMNTNYPRATEIVSFVFKLLFDDFHTEHKLNIFRHFGVLPPYILADREVWGGGTSSKLEERVGNLLRENNSGMSIQQAIQNWKSQVASMIGIS